MLVNESEEELDPNASVTNLAFGSNLFRWTITKNSCSSFDDVELKYNRIVANAGAAQTICSDETLLEGNIDLDLDLFFIGSLFII